MSLSAMAVDAGRCAVQIFLDTADVKEIRELAALGVVDGVTTNPSLVAKEGRPFREIAAEILQIVDGPISLEVVSTDAPGMMAEARELAKLHKNVVVKIPLIAEGLKAVKQLSGEGIRTNVTLCFSAAQALLAAKAGAGYISPFVGRLDDISHVGMDLVRHLQELRLPDAGPGGQPAHADSFRRSCAGGSPCLHAAAAGPPPAPQASAHRHWTGTISGGLEKGAEDRIGGAVRAALHTLVDMAGPPGLPRAVCVALAKASSLAWSRAKIR
jgi:TalC/MipB family fructose-6-phosphate aldolase